ncbi:hypothetical protein GCM10007866_22930 [Gluconobacter albidus]|uniref:Uncharacterized protein n=1 Tax=Gluconobacter albidus TaxID=318683 RepID=A0ABQ5X208_9PROT|nr:hypothetical protein GCM10007866_22930 [Gluconobacter albidus]
MARCDGTAGKPLPGLEIVQVGPADPRCFDPDADTAVRQVLRYRDRENLNVSDAGKTGSKHEIFPFPSD